MTFQSGREFSSGVDLIFIRGIRGAEIFSLGVDFLPSFLIFYLKAEETRGAQKTLYLKLELALDSVINATYKTIRAFSFITKSRRMSEA